MYPERDIRGDRRREEKYLGDNLSEAMVHLVRPYIEKYQGGHVYFPDRSRLCVRPQYVGPAVSSLNCFDSTLRPFAAINVTTDGRCLLGEMIHSDMLLDMLSWVRDWHEGDEKRVIRIFDRQARKQEIKRLSNQARSLLGKRKEIELFSIGAGFHHVPEDEPVVHRLHLCKGVGRRVVGLLEAEYGLRDEATADYLTFRLGRRSVEMAQAIIEGSFSEGMIADALGGEKAKLDCWKDRKGGIVTLEMSHFHLVLLREVMSSAHKVI